MAQSCPGPGPHPVNCSLTACCPLQQRNLVLVFSDVYLASCLSIFLSYSIAIKGQKKIPRLETFCFLQKEYFCSQLCGWKHFFLWSRVGWVGSHLSLASDWELSLWLPSKSVHSMLFFKGVFNGVGYVHEWTDWSVWVSTSLYMGLWMFRGRENLGVLSHMLDISAWLLSFHHLHDDQTDSDADRRREGWYMSLMWICKESES